jgi:hypothetical protein
LGLKVWSCGLFGIAFHNRKILNSYDIIGTIGVGVIVVTYLLLQLGRIKSEQFVYSLLNGMGAALILISLYYDFNLPSVIVEAFWLVISIFGILKYLVARPS